MHLRRATTAGLRTWKNVLTLLIHQRNEKVAIKGRAGSNRPSAAAIRRSSERERAGEWIRAISGTLLCATLLNGCSNEAPNTEQKDSVPSKNLAEPTVEIVTVGGEKFYRRVFGDRVFQFPEQIAREGLGGSYLKVWFRWPSMELQRSWGHEPNNVIFLVVGADSKRPPTVWSIERSIESGGYFGPFTDSSSGLIVYRQSKPGFTLYKSAENDFRDAMGDQPYVTCQPPPKSDEPAHCRVDGWLTPQIRYYYEFKAALLADWPAVDSRIRNFLTSMIISAK
jgi:hypothetical protein